MTDMIAKYKYVLYYMFIQNVFHEFENLFKSFNSSKDGQVIKVSPCQQILIRRKFSELVKYNNNNFFSL